MPLSDTKLLKVSIYTQGIHLQTQKTQKNDKTASFIHVAKQQTPIQTAGDVSDTN